VSSHPLMVNPRQIVRAIIFASLLSVLSAASMPLASGQQFTLSVSALTPAVGVDPGGSATATIDLQPVGVFDGSIALSCSVTSNQFTTNLPQCVVSPASAIPPADGPALTITTTGGTGASATQAGTYQVTVTGTGGTTTQTVLFYLSVADLTEDYTLTVSPTTAIPSPLPAGSSATTTVSVLPIGDYTERLRSPACRSLRSSPQRRIARSTLRPSASAPALELFPLSPSERSEPRQAQPGCGTFA